MPGVRRGYWGERGHPPAGAGGLFAPRPPLCHMPGIDLGSDIELGSGSSGKGHREAGPCPPGAYNLVVKSDLGEGKEPERSSDAAEACGCLNLLLR